jgi:hypothetical protein
MARSKALKGFETRKYNPLNEKMGLPACSRQASLRIARNDYIGWIAVL